MKNIFKVKKSIWKSWSSLARQTFNEVYGSTYNDQKLVAPWGDATMQQKNWEILCWNFSLVAANAVDGYKTVVLQSKQSKTGKVIK